MQIPFGKMKKGTLVAIMWVCILVLTVLLVFVFKHNRDEMSSSAENEQPSTIQMDGEGQIVTPYVAFSVPTKWEPYLHIKTATQEDVYKVCFYGALSGREEQHLFDLIFGKSEAFWLGTFEIDGETIDLFAESYDLIIDRTWSEEERNDLYAMQDLINVILDQMKEMENFTASP